MTTLLYNYGFLYFLLLIVCSLFFISFNSNNDKSRLTLNCIASLFIALVLFETYMIFRTPNVNPFFSGTYVDNKNVSGEKDILGYGPKKDTSFQVSAIRHNDSKKIFDVIYTFDNGQRKIPYNNNSSTNSIFFLGCSHVFGDGLNDNQTLPYYFSEYTSHKFNVENLAFSGYGTHQALKIVEEIILKQKKITENSSVIYSFIPSHIERAAGFTSWDIKTPCYEIENDSLTFKGSFEKNGKSNPNFLLKRMGIIWNNSNLYKSFFQPSIREKDVVRIIELIKKMSILLKSYHLKFIVIVNYTDLEDEYKKLFYNSLKMNNIEMCFVDSIIKDYENNQNIYSIIGDGHPNELFNKRVAKHLTELID